MKKWKDKVPELGLFTGFHKSHLTAPKDASYLDKIAKKIEQNYSEIENVCLVDMKIIYIYVTNVSAYMLPLSCFKSKVELDEFIGFLQTKGIKVDRYC